RAAGGADRAAAGGVDRAAAGGVDSGGHGSGLSAAVGSGGAGGTIRGWGVTKGNKMFAVELGAGPINCLAVLPDPSAVVCGAGDGAVYIVDLAGSGGAGGSRGIGAGGTGAENADRGCVGTTRARFTGHRGPVLGVAVSADGALVASAGQDGT